MANNLAAVITAHARAPELQSTPFPMMEKGGAIVRVDAATLCGTDIARWKGSIGEGGKDQPFRRQLELPFVPGHETCGTIVELGGEVFDILGQPLADGDRVISSYGHCGHCYYCRVTRQTSFCGEVISYGHWHPDRMMGGCAQFHYYPPSASLVRVPESVDPAVAASGTCALRTVMHAFELLGPLESHETVLVLGAGPLGLYALSLAKDRGANRVLLIGGPQHRLEVAKSWGADEVLDIDAVPVTDERIDWVRSLTGGRGADLVINCASGPALVEALRMVRPGGRLSQIAAPGGKEIAVPPQLLFKGVRPTFPVMAEARHFHQAMLFLEARGNGTDFSKMISNAFTLDQCGAALKGMAELTELKPVIYPNGPPEIRP